MATIKDEGQDGCFEEMENIKNGLRFKVGEKEYDYEGYRHWMYDLHANAPEIADHLIKGIDRYIQKRLDSLNSG